MGQTKQALLERKLETAIEKGHWKIGDKLPPERELCKEMGVSRTTLRFALYALCGKGLLELRQGSGAYVTASSDKVIRSKKSSFDLQQETLEAGLLLFPSLCANITRQITPTQILILENLLPQVGIALHSMNVQAFAEAQHRFFVELVKSFQNEQLTAAMNMVLPNVKILQQILKTKEQAYWERIFAFLAQILNACRKVDDALAVQASKSYFLLLSGKEAELHEHE